MPLVRVVAAGGLTVFTALAVVASVSVGNRFNPVPLAIILVMGAASAAYTVTVVPRLQAADAARRAAPGRHRAVRRPPRGAVRRDPNQSPAPTTPGRTRPRGSTDRTDRAVRLGGRCSTASTRRSRSTSRRSSPSRRRAIPVIQARIAERLDKAAPSVSEMLDRLEADGLIARSGRRISS